MRRDSLNCPYCDEHSRVTNRWTDGFNIYARRECVMGHRFISVESIPEDQDAVAAELRERKLICLRRRKELLEICRQEKGGAATRAGGT